MRFFYIICLVLSSVFTYKHAVANEQEIKYAFFTPNDVFQNNLSVNEIKNMQPRYGNQVMDKEKNDKQSDSVIPSKVTKIENISDSTSSNKTVKKAIMPVKSTISEVELSEPLQKEDKAPQDLPPEIKEKLKKYSLDDEITFDIIKKIDSNGLAKKQNQSINTLLAQIPSPDFSAPKFKQIYAHHGMALRALYRTGKIPYNQEQEDALAKANGIHRQKVE